MFIFMDPTSVIESLSQSSPKSSIIILSSTELCDFSVSISAWSDGVRMSNALF